MNTPKFTAEASLYNHNLHYKATTDPGICGGVVQPASPFSNASYSNRPVPVFSSLLRQYHARPTFCLTTWCPFGQLWCYPVIGIWNPITSSCEGPVEPFHTF